MADPTLAMVDDLLKSVMAPSESAIAEARKDPRVREYIGLGGTDALDGVKEMEPCAGPVHAAPNEKRPGADDYCEYGDDGHDRCWKFRSCHRCGDEGEVWTGRWWKRPTRDRRKRRRLAKLRKLLGWSKVYMAENGSPIGNALNASVPLFAALDRQRKREKRGRRR